VSDVAAAVSVTGLRKTYSSRRGRAPHTALAGLDLQVHGGGHVHGFLGPNGSGKTTTLRVLSGLVRADSGSVAVLGAAVPSQLPSVVARVGSLVEEPTFFRPFTGRLNLELLAGTAALPPRAVDVALDRVGLADRAQDKVGGYSLGMRQRLGIAAALLKQPDLLVLDEPSNGLDPAGIREIRDLLRTLARDGVTVVLSSHLLAEVQQVCDEVTIISRGRTVTAGPVGQVLAGGGDEGRLRVVVEPAQQAADVLAAAGWTVTPDAAALLVSGAPDAAAVTRVLAEQGLYLSELRADTVDLEEVFLALTEGPGTEQGAA